MLELSTDDLRPTAKEQARDCEEFGADFISEPTPACVAETIMEDVALMQKQGQFTPARNRCRCGADLPQVSDDETPPEFCSEDCKAVAEMI